MNASSIHLSSNWRNHIEADITAYEGDTLIENRNIQNKERPCLTWVYLANLTASVVKETLNKQSNADCG
jgi:hypothetical protein